MASVATMSVCTVPPSLVLRFPLGGRELIYSRRNELPHRRCRRQWKQAGEREKIIPAQIFTLIVPWAAISTVKESIGLYSYCDCGPHDTQRALKTSKLSHMIATPSDRSLQKKRARPNGPCPVMPIPECFFSSAHLPHVGIGSSIDALGLTLFPMLKGCGSLQKPAAFCLWAVESVVRQGTCG